MRSNMSPQEIFRHVLVRALGVLCAVVFAALVVDVLFGVFTRQVLNDQPAWTEELARFLLVWLALLGGVLAYADDRHLGVDVLVSHLHPSSRRVAIVTSHLCVLGFAVVVLVLGGLELFRNRWDAGQMMATLGIRKAWFYMVLPLGGSLIALLALGKTIDAIRGKYAKEEAS